MDYAGVRIYIQDQAGRWSEAPETARRQGIPGCPCSWVCAGILMRFYEKRSYVQCVLAIEA